MVVVVVGGSEAVDAVGGSVAEFVVGSSQDERLHVSSVSCAPLFPTVSGCLLLTFFSCAASCAPLFPDSKKKFCKYFVLDFFNLVCAAASGAPLIADLGNNSEKSVYSDFTRDIGVCAKSHLVTLVQMY